MTARELLTRIAPRLKASTGGESLDFLTACEVSSGAIADRLHEIRSGLIRQTWDDTVSASDPMVVLPPRFKGFSDRPWWMETGTTTKTDLYPLPDGIGNRYTEEGTPLYYAERSDGQLQWIDLIPTPSVAGSIGAEIYQRPVPVSSLDSQIPWPGIFDAVMYELVPRVIMGGLSIMVDQSTEEWLRQQVDRVVVSRSNRDIYWIFPA